MTPLLRGHEPVVSQHGGHGNSQTDSGHDQGFTHGAGHLVDGGLTGNADGGQGVVDAPDGAEQTDEGEMEPTVARKDRPLCISRFTRSTERWMLMLIQSFRECVPSGRRAFGGFQAGCGDELVGAVLVRGICALTHRACRPELLGCFAAKAAHLALFQHLDGQGCTSCPCS